MSPSSMFFIQFNKEVIVWCDLTLKTGPRCKMATSQTLQQRTTCPYMDTIDRKKLDFDFEKICSVTLATTNVYACLVCGQYLCGRGTSSAAYFHSLDVEHHVFINLTSLKVYCLPDNYEVTDASLNDIKVRLRPRQWPSVNTLIQYSMYCDRRIRLQWSLSSIVHASQCTISTTKYMFRVDVLISSALFLSQSDVSRESQDSLDSITSRPQTTSTLPYRPSLMWNRCAIFACLIHHHNHKRQTQHQKPLPLVRAEWFGILRWRWPIDGIL